MVVLHALGQCLIRTATAAITPRADMCFGLTAYLTSERGRRIPRRALQALLWPAMRADDASHSLSELIHKLRARGVPIERDDASCVWLPRDAASIDIESLAREAPSVVAGLDLTVLPGYAPPGSPEFNDWVDEWRDRMQLRVLHHVVSAIARASEARDWPVALALADGAITIDPNNDAALVARATAAAKLAQGGRPSDINMSAQPGRHSATRSAERVHERLAPTAWTEASGSRDQQLPIARAADTPIVGRAEALRRITEQVSAAFRGDIAGSYIWAPAGVGKSRLIREIVTQAQARRAAVCPIACGRHDGHRPLSLFAQAVPRLRMLPGAAGCAPNTVARLDLITRLEEDGADIVAQADSLHVSDAIRAAVLDLIDAVADEQPLLLVVEDAHWIDPVSLSLLRTIASTPRTAVAVVCTSRVRWQLATWGDPHPFVMEELAPLTASDAHAHLSGYLDRLQKTCDASYVDWCVSTSGGNPYFAEELVNYWIATGEQYTAPPSLVALVEARVACLGPGALRVLQAAAILGNNSTVELLRQVLEFPVHALFDALEELGAAGLLAVAPSDPATAPLICRHDLVTRAALRGLSAHGRALLHHAAASAIEPLAAENHSISLLWDCADHWQTAGQQDRSIRSVVACSRHLHDVGLLQQAISCCQSALAASPNITSKALLLRAMAQAHYTARDWGDFCAIVAEVRQLEGGLPTAGSIHDDLELCELNAQRSLHRDWERALDVTLRCVHAQEADASHRVQAAVSAFKLATNIGALDVMDAVHATISPLLSSEGVRTQDRLTFTMIYHTIRGDSRTAAQTARELLALVERIMAERHRISIMGDCAGALRRCGFAGEAEGIYAEVFRTSVVLGCFDWASEACHRLIEMCTESGQISVASAWAVRYRRLRRPKSELGAQRNLRLALARLHMSRGAWKQGKKLLEWPSVALLWNDPVAMFRSGAIATKIRLEIGCGSAPAIVAEWVTRLAPLNARLRRTGAQDYETYSLYLGYLHLGDVEQATQLLRQYAGTERRDATPIAQEIGDELLRISPTRGRPDEGVELPACAEATDGKNT